MPPTDLIQALRKRPFQAFRLLISDGSKYDIHHPELLMVGLGSAVIGIPAAGQATLPYEHYVTVDTRHLVKMIPLPEAAAPASGATSN
jgi:hypothetical protein